MRRHDDSLKEHSSLSQCVDKTRRGSPEHWLNQCRLVRFIGLVGPYFRDGANEVEAFEVERTAQGPVLHPVGWR